MPALAVVGPDHRIVRSTETFRRRYDGAEKMCESSPELQQVLAGHVDVATVSLGDLSVAIEAVTDATGRRQAMLTLPPLDPAPSPEPPLDALRRAAEESQAIVWAKDLEGRYLYANPRYEEELDGPRLRDTDERLSKPLQLNYTVPAAGGRPALAVFRFALRDHRGQPIATCGVAAPTTDAHVARDEAVRLMQLERWNRLDPVEVRAELLEQWHVHTAPRAVEEISRPPEATAAPVPAPPPSSALIPPIQSDTAKLLQTDLVLARRWANRAEALQSELEQAQVRIGEIETDAQQAWAAAARAAEDAGRWRAEAEQTRAELERILARLHSQLSDFETSS